jgi:hypothetical protein
MQHCDAPTINMLGVGDWPWLQCSCKPSLGWHLSGACCIVTRCTVTVAYHAVQCQTHALQGKQHLMICKLVAYLDLGLVDSASLGCVM